MVSLHEGIAYQFDSSFLQRVASLLAAQDQPIYLVGGAVRDLLLNRAVKDLDFAVADGAISLTFNVANSLGLPAYILDRERDTGRIVVNRENIFLDFSRFRGTDIFADLLARDFTINAMALPAQKMGSRSPLNHLIDPSGGLSDLKLRRIVQASDKAILADPVRALRAIRLAHQLGFEISDDTFNSIEAYAANIQDSSVERLRDEFIKILALPHPYRAISSLMTMNLLPFLLPDITNLDGVKQSFPHYEDVLAHTMRSLQNLVDFENRLFLEELSEIPRINQAFDKFRKYQKPLRKHLNRPITGGLNGRLILRLGALFHDVGKPATFIEDGDGRIRFIGHEKRGSEIAIHSLKGLKFSNQAIDAVASIVYCHMRPLLLTKENEVSRRAIYRYFQSAGTSGIDCCLLSIADYLAIFPDSDDNEWNKLLSTANRLLEQYFQYYEQSIEPDPLLTGTDLIGFLNLESGPLIGWLLNNLKEAQATGEIKTRTEALDLARTLLQDYRH